MDLEMLWFHIMDENLDGVHEGYMSSAWANVSTTIKQTQQLSWPTEL